VRARDLQSPYENDKWEKPEEKHLDYILWCLGNCLKIDKYGLVMKMEGTYARVARIALLIPGQEGYRKPHIVRVALLKVFMTYNSYNIIAWLYDVHANKRPIKVMYCELGQHDCWFRSFCLSELFLNQ
jgi:hypothetical protein